MGVASNTSVNFEKRWNDEVRYRCFYPSLSIIEKGLVLGAGTILAPMQRDRFGMRKLTIDGREEQILALLSLGFNRSISIDAVKFIKRASAHWARGDKTLAHVELAYARLPKSFLLLPHKVSTSLG